MVKQEALTLPTNLLHPQNSSTSAENSNTFLNNQSSQKAWTSMMFDSSLLSHLTWYSSASLSGCPSPKTSLSPTNSDHLYWQQSKPPSTAWTWVAFPQVYLWLTSVPLHIPASCDFQKCSGILLKPSLNASHGCQNKSILLLPRPTGPWWSGSYFFISYHISATLAYLPSFKPNHFFHTSQPLSSPILLL